MQTERREEETFDGWFIDPSQRLLWLVWLVWSLALAVAGGAIAQSLTPRGSLMRPAVFVLCGWAVGLLIVLILRRHSRRHPRRLSRLPHLDGAARALAKVMKRGGGLRELIVWVDDTPGWSHHEPNLCWSRHLVVSRWLLTMLSPSEMEFGLAHAVAGWQAPLNWARRLGRTALTTLGGLALHVVIGILPALLIPVLVLACFGASLVITPQVMRRQDESADKRAVRATGDRDAAISCLDKLAPYAGRGSLVARFLQARRARLVAGK
ncbi:MAG: hypothetical protein IH851_05480 [Armatimonadetes bacterium]|nr:hypothetical protein [Armatimonadota bacterium]